MWKTAQNTADLQLLLLFYIAQASFRHRTDRMDCMDKNF